MLPDSFRGMQPIAEWSPSGWRIPPSSWRKTPRGSSAHSRSRLSGRQGISSAFSYRQHSGALRGEMEFITELVEGPDYHFGNDLVVPEGIRIAGVADPSCKMDDASFMKS